MRLTGNPLQMEIGALMCSQFCNGVGDVEMSGEDDALLHIKEFRQLLAFAISIFHCLDTFMRECEDHKRHLVARILAIEPSITTASLDSTPSLRTTNSRPTL